jgi:hypothetical protein
MNKKIYKAEIPEIWGMGLEVYDETPEKAIKSLRLAWNELKKDYGVEPCRSTFKKVWDYFGGSIQKIELGIAIVEGMGEYVKVKL